MTDAPRPLRILALEAENFAKLKAVSIRPDGHLVEITGKNRNGKTSVLNAIWVALAGLKVAPVEPIRHGEERARVRLELGDDDGVELIVTRRFTADEFGGYTSDLKVEGAAGNKFSRGQEVLSAMLGALTFDPGVFVRANDEERLAMMRPLAPDVDFDALKAANKADYEARTAENSKAKDRRAQANGIALPPGKVPAKIDVSALEEELAGSAQFNAGIEDRKQRRAAAIREADALDEEIAEDRARLEAKLERVAGLRQRLAEAEELPAPKDILAIRAKLSEARTANEVAEKAARRDALNAEALAAENASATLTASIDGRNAEMAAAVAKAVGAVQGLGFANERLTLNGTAFDMGSDAEKLEASILIAGLLNPTLRVIRVRDGSLMDEDALAALAEIAERHDLQIWIERVDSTGAVGFVLEDGEIKGPNTSPAPRPNERADARMAGMAMALADRADTSDEEEAV